MLLNTNKILEFKEYSLLQSRKLRQFCKPLDEAYGIKTFSYMKITNQGKKIHFCSNENWLNVAFIKNLYNNLDLYIVFPLYK